MSVQFSNTSSGGSGTASIPEYGVDPVAPVPGDAWVLRVGGVTGSPIGLLLALTSTSKYCFSYRTLSNTTVRTILAP